MADTLRSRHARDSLMLSRKAVQRHRTKNHDPERERLSLGGKGAENRIWKENPNGLAGDERDARKPCLPPVSVTDFVLVMLNSLRFATRPPPFRKVVKSKNRRANRVPNTGSLSTTKRAANRLGKNVARISNDFALTACSSIKCTH